MELEELRRQQLQNWFTMMLLWRIVLIQEYGFVSQKFLLVLDDVWDDDYEKYERLKNLVHNGLDGSTLSDYSQ